MPYTHLTPIERGQIELLLRDDKNPEYISRQLNRSASSIRREISRNSTRSGYSAQKAQKRYEQRREACRPQLKLSSSALREYMARNIRDNEWTPEQVAGRLPLDYPDDHTMRISHETIYRCLYEDRSLRFLIAYLPQSRPKRRKRGQGKSRRGPLIPNRVGIEQRPEAVENREETGHWEADTIVGKAQDGFIVTLVERTARQLHMTPVAAKNARDVAQAIIACLLDKPTSWLKSITFDNGPEFSGHQAIADALGIDIYFADPYAPHQRGTNENTNGLIRRYLPKGTSFENLSTKQIKSIEEQLNNRPRKCLGYRTPNEVFQEQREAHYRALAI